jgi:hypothetical protein
MLARSGCECDLCFFMSRNVTVRVVVLDRKKLTRELAKLIHDTVEKLPPEGPPQAAYYAAAAAALEFCEARLRPYFSKLGKV